MNVVLVSSNHDRARALRLEGALSGAGHSAAVVYPDADSQATLPARTRQLAQAADYFIYLISARTCGAQWLNRLTSEQVAPLCAAGLRILLLVYSEGNLPPTLAHLPYLYFLDEITAPSLVDRLVESLGQVHSLPAADIEVLRYGVVDLEAFLETAQGLAFAYTGLQSAWEALAVHLSPNEQDLPVELALFHRYAANIGAGITFRSRARLEKRVLDQLGGSGLAGQIIRDYETLEQDWKQLERSFLTSASLPETILQARTRAAAFLNLIYLVMALRLLPYCEQYLHMQGLKQVHELHVPAWQLPDPAEARLSFLISNFGYGEFA